MEATAKYEGKERRVQDRRSGSDQRHYFEKSEQFVVVKSWHVVISILTLIIVTTLWFGSLRDDTANNTREIQEIKRQNLTRDLYELGQKNTEKRLERIEQKLDAQDVRNWAIDSVSKSKKD
jgi:hypothetical protein